MERYRFFTDGDSQVDGFFDKLENKAKELGSITITRISPSEVLIEGEYDPILELMFWLTEDESNLKKVRYLRWEE